MTLVAERTAPAPLPRQQEKPLPPPRIVSAKSIPVRNQPIPVPAPIGQPAGPRPVEKEKREASPPPGPGGGSGPENLASISPGLGPANDAGVGGIGAGGGGTGGSGSGGSGGGSGGGIGGGTGSGGGGNGAGGGGTGGGGVDGPLQFLHKVNPEYPVAARRRQKEGLVDVIATVDEKGTLIKVDVVKATSQMFVEAVMDALKQSTYVPAGKKGLRRGSFTARFTLEQ